MNKVEEEEAHNQALHQQTERRYLGIHNKNGAMLVANSVLQTEVLLHKITEDRNGVDKAELRQAPLHQTDPKVAGKKEEGATIDATMDAVVDQ